MSNTIPTEIFDFLAQEVFHYKVFQTGVHKDALGDQGDSAPLRLALVPPTLGVTGKAMFVCVGPVHS